MKKFRYNGREYLQFSTTPFNIDHCFMLDNRDLLKDETVIDSLSFVSKPVCLKKVDKEGRLLPFTEYETEAISVWLFSKEYKTLTIGNYNYKAIFLPVHEVWTDCGGNGILNFKLVLKNKAFSNKLLKSVSLINTEKILTISNKSNYSDNPIYTEIYIKNKKYFGKEHSTTISIENKSISNNKIEISNLVENDEIYINGLNSYIKRNDGSNVDYIGEFIKLNNEVNNIELKADGVCKIDIAFTEEYKLVEVFSLE